MPISLETLDKIYHSDFDSHESKSWIAIPDSKGDELIAGVTGSSGGNPGNGWKIHISIDPEKIAEAAHLIVQELNSERAPRVSIKLAGKQLAHTGQPSKQVAFIFYEEELKNKLKIAAFLNRIEFLLRSHNIGVDPRPINSDEEDIQTKYDAVLLNTEGKPTRFNYRNEWCIVMEDELYYEVGGRGDTAVQGQQIWVKQSYYLGLPDSQKHNPGHRVADPFAQIQLDSPILSVARFPQTTTRSLRQSTEEVAASHASKLTPEHIVEVNSLIRKLEKEINSCWPYPHKHRKAEKVKGLKALLVKAEMMDASAAVEEVEQEFPDIRKGSISTRTADLLDSLRHDNYRLEL